MEIQDEAGRRLGRARLPEGIAGVAALHELISGHLPSAAGDGAGSDDAGQVWVGIETDRGPWVQALVAAGYRIFPVNPRQVARYRERHSNAGAKSDVGDAHALADMVRTDGHQLRAIAGDSPLAAGVKLLARAHQTLIWERTRHMLRLRAGLREYFPAALAAFENLAAAEALELLAKAPDPTAAARLTRAQIGAALRRARRRDIDTKTAEIMAALRSPGLTQPLPVVAAAAVITRSLTAESVLGLLIRWHHDIPAGDGDLTEDDACEVIRSALVVARLEPIGNTIRQGGYRVRKSADRFVVSHRWDPAPEVVDMLLENAHLPRPPSPGPAEQEWVTSLTASRRRPPHAVLRAAVERAAAAITALRITHPEGPLPPDFDLGDGLIVADAVVVLAALAGLAELRQNAADHRKRTETTLLHSPRPALVDLVCELAPSIGRAAVETLLDRLTYAPGRSVRNSPLVDLDGVVLLCPPLLSPRLIDPLVLRSAAYDPKRFGSVGRRMGQQVQGWTDWLTAVPDALVATGVKLVAADGRTAGDLDLVAVDPTAGVVVCLEIKTPIDAWNWTEVNKSEDILAAGIRQLAKRRRQLEDGIAMARFPRHWLDLRGFTWTWAVGLPQQLCLRPSPEPDIRGTSLRYLLSLGTPPDLATVARVMRDPPMPVRDTHFSIKAITIELDRAEIRVDALAVHPETPFEPAFPAA